MKKRILCLFTTLVLCFSMAPHVYAESTEVEQAGKQSEAEIAKEEEKTTILAIEELEKQENESSNDDVGVNATEEWDSLSIIIPGGHDVLEVAQGTNLDQYDLEVVLNNFSTGGSEYSPLLNSMVSGFDNSKLGRQDVIVTWKGYSCTLKVNVVKGEISKAVSIEASIPFMPLKDNVIPTGFPQNELKDIVYVEYYDEAGNQVDLGEEMPVETSEIDTTVVGEHKVTVTSAGMETVINVRVANMKGIITECDGETDVIKVPANGAIDRKLMVNIVNADNSSELFGASDFLPIDLPKLDLTKAGIQEYNFYDKNIEENWLHTPTIVTVKVSVDVKDEIGNNTNGNQDVTTDEDDNSKDELTNDDSESNKMEFGESESEKTTPKTGDSQNVIPFLIMGLASFCVLGGCIILKVKRIGK